MEKEIREFIYNLKTKYKIMPYVYNDDETFKEGDSVYYSGPYWNEEELSAAMEALLSGVWISSGEKVRLFEKKFSRRFNQADGVMVNSGSSANLVMISALKKYYNWKDGDEIIVSVVGFPTTISTIVQNNLKPVFADIELETLNFNLNRVWTLINRKTKAVFLSPVLGNPPDMDRLVNLCNNNNILLILDNCDSLGSTWNDKYLNEYAVASSYSFYPAHHISTGEGGMITSNNLELLELARKMTTWGRDCHCSGKQNLLPNGMCKKRFSRWLEDYDGTIDHKYVFTQMGYNLKPLDLQGAIGLAQLKKVDEIFSKRRNSKNVITKIFTDKGIKVPVSYPNADVCWFGTPFICDSKEEKQKLVSYLESNKIQTRNYFAGNILIHPGFKHLGNFKDYPNANLVLDRVFFIGSAPHYGKNIFNYIKKVMDNYD